MSDYSGSIFARGVPPAIDNPRWDDFANAFVPNQVQLTEHKRMVKTVMAELAVPTGAKLLEVGAGIGTMALEMANQGLDVWDFDIVPANVDLVERVSGSLGLGGSGFFDSRAWMLARSWSRFFVFARKPPNPFRIFFALA